MANSPIIVTWPGGIGNPIQEHIPTSGGKRKTRKVRKGRKTRKVRKGRKTRRGASACAGTRRCWSRRN